MLLETALSVGYTAFFLWLIMKLPFFRFNEVNNRTIQLLFLVKLLAGFVLYIIYTRYYPDRKYADIFRYYDDSSIIFNTLKHSPYDFFRMFTGFHSGDKDLWVYYNAMNNWFNSVLLFNDARTMIRLSTLFRCFSAGTYYPVSIFFCFMAFGGLVALYKVVSFHLKGRSALLLFGILLMPSVLLWSSGIIKEAFLLFALGFTVYFVHLLSDRKTRNFRNLIYMLFFLFCLLNIKAYVVMAVMPGLISYYWLRTTNKSLAALKFAFVHLLYIIGLSYASVIFTGITLPERLRDKQFEFLQLADRENAGSTVEIPRLDGSFTDLLLNAPSAFVLTLARPSLPEADSILTFLSALENTFIVVLTLVLLYRIFNKKFATEGSVILLFSLFYLTIMFCLIGWVTPILGAVVRYKVAALPFLMVLLFSDNKWKEWVRISTFYKKSG